MHNDFVPFDADRATLAAFLEGHPEWERTNSCDHYVSYWHPSFPRRYDRIEIPANDDPHFSTEDRTTCRTAARLINAVTLGVPTSTPEEAVRRLVEITEWARTRGAGIPDSLTAELLAITTGTSVTR
ncbi:hypothetical protein [Planomonospora algeriensis]